MKKNKHTQIDKSSFNRQTRGGSSHQFAFNPTLSSSTSKSNTNTINSNNSNNGNNGMPVTAILFTNGGITHSHPNQININNTTCSDIISNKSNCLINVSQQQQSAISPTNHLSLLERQM
jgi:hypothetical protein